MHAAHSLTVSAHPGRDALFEAAVLATVTVDAQDGALLILGARTVLDLLLDRPAKEALKRNRETQISAHYSSRAFIKYFVSRLANFIFRSSLYPMYLVYGDKGTSVYITESDFSQWGRL